MKHSAFPTSVLIPEAPFCPTTTETMTSNLPVVSPCTVEAGTVLTSLPRCPHPSSCWVGPLTVVTWRLGPVVTLTRQDSAHRSLGKLWAGHRAQCLSSVALCWGFEEQQGALRPETWWKTLPAFTSLRSCPNEGCGLWDSWDRASYPAFVNAACVLLGALP